jgi:hypothetical protein
MKKTLGCLLGMLLTLSASAEAFRLTQRIETIPEVGPVTRYVLTLGRAECSFIPPRTWGGLVREDEKMIIFRPETGLSSIGLKFLAAQDDAPLPSKNEDWPAYLQNVLGSEFQIVEQGDCYAANTRGHMFTLQAPGDARIRRVAYVQKENLILRFELISSLEEFPQAHLAWTALLNSFRATSRPVQRNASLSERL